jgi:AcrR family transcriptional regulator
VSAASNATANRILDGALRALARRGLRKLSMSDICEEAGISRGTLYRYFKSKEDVLEAIGQHVEEGFRQDIAEAIRKRPQLEQRLRVVLDVLVAEAASRPAILMRDAEPGFTLQFLTRELPVHVEIVRKALEPVMKDLPAVREGVITQTQLAEIFVRITDSATLLPGPQTAKLPKRLADLWASLTGTSAVPSSAPRARAG